MKIRCGIDLGGTKIAIACLDDNHQLRYQNRVETPQGHYEETLDSIKSLIIKAESKLKCEMPVGIGTPGAISTKTGLLKNSNSTCLNNKPLKQDLESLLQRPVKIENDANCFALSEATDGAGADKEVIFGVIIGTGTGAGIVINGQILAGINRIAGEWGHNPLPWHDCEHLQQKPCYCGKFGCIETFLSGPGLSDEYQSLYHSERTSPEIVQGAKEGDDQCEKIMRQYERNLAKALAHVVNIIDPDCIILGGGMSNISRLYQNVPKIWNEYIFSDHVSTQLLPPKFGDASGVRGAARLWPLHTI